GVGSIVGMRSLVQNLRRAVTNEVRTFFGGDVRVGNNQPWSKEARESLDRLNHSPLVTGNTEFLELQTMLRAAQNKKARPMMVQLRAVQPSFPLYGEVQLQDGALYSPAMLKNRGVLLQPTLLQQLNLNVGDTVKIGKLTFTIRGVLEFLPGNEMQFGSMQRAVVAYDDAIAAGLTGAGSRVNYTLLFKAPEGMDEALVRQLSHEMRHTRLTYLASFRWQQNWLSRTLENNDSFLGLVGLAILVLGGIGIASVSRVFVQQKRKSIAILKCLGGENRQVLTAYFLQILVLSVIGSVLGLVLASGITHAASRYAVGRLPFPLVPGVTWAASWQGLALGVLITLLFGLPPLLEIRTVKPLLVLRQDAAGHHRADRWRILAMIGSVVGLLALVSALARSWQQALIFVGWLVGTTIVLNLAGFVLMFLLRRLRRLPWFVLRQGIGSLYRPGNQTKMILFAVGLGALFIIAIRLEQAIVMREFNFELDGAAADVFVVDVQKEQRDNVEETLARLSGNQPVLIPVVPGNIVDLKRAPQSGTKLSVREMSNRFNWERRFSYRPRLERTGQVIAGKFQAQR
ncbi:MAG: FtsX-like permease family protein, partial [Blastocatellia bacterium]